MLPQYSLITPFTPSNDTVFISPENLYEIRPAPPAKRRCPVMRGNAFPDDEEEDGRWLPSGAAVLITAMVEVYMGSKVPELRVYMLFRNSDQWVTERARARGGNIVA